MRTYNDCEIIGVNIVHGGGFSIVGVTQGIDKYNQHKYENDSRYRGGNGTYINIADAEYEKVEYSFILTIRVRWMYDGEQQEVIKKQDITDYIDYGKRMTENKKNIIRNAFIGQQIVMQSEKAQGAMYADWYIDINKVKEVLRSINMLRGN